MQFTEYWWAAQTGDIKNEAKKYFVATKKPLFTMMVLPHIKTKNNAQNIQVTKVVIS